MTDEGTTYRGDSHIRDRLDRAASDYTYTIDLTAAAKVDKNRYTATHHLEGDFPGGVADPRFRFTPRDGRIARPIIEPQGQTSRVRQSLLARDTHASMQPRFRCAVLSNASR